MHPEIASPAYVLRTRAYGESDRIVTLLTDLQGKITGIAKGAKNSRRRFAGTLEPFLRVRIAFRVRPHSDLAFLLRCELMHVFRGFGRDLERFAAGSYVLELTDRMVLGRESGHEIYRLVDETLTRLDADGPSEPLLRAFELHLLAATGYAPTLDSCRSCGRELETDVTYLTTGRGGFVCRGCIRPDEPVRPVDTAAVRALAALAAAPLGVAATSVVDPVALREAATIAELLIAAVVAGPLHSRGFLARARVDSPGGVR